MHRLYIVLLPHYRKDEVEKEILSEWIFDCHGRQELDYILFTKVLFRIAHSWCIHVDYEEYAFLLTILYERVTCKVLIKSKTRREILPKIMISFPEEEKKFSKDKGEDEDENEENGAEWMECDEDESPRSDFEYKYGDENDTMDLKRYKRPKNGSGLGVMITTHIKEPFLYSEKVNYDLSGVEEGVTIVDQLMKTEYVLPLGYPTEQYLFKLKNDVYEVVKQQKEKSKGFEDENKDFDDPGDLKVKNERVTQTFFLFSNNGFHKEYTF